MRNAICIGCVIATLGILLLMGRAAADTPQPTTAPLNSRIFELERRVNSLKDELDQLRTQHIALGGQLQHIDHDRTELRSSMAAVETKAEGLYSKLESNHLAIVSIACTFALTLFGAGLALLYTGRRSMLETAETHLTARMNEMLNEEKSDFEKSVNAQGEKLQENVKARLTALAESVESRLEEMAKEEKKSIYTEAFLIIGVAFWQQYVQATQEEKSVVPGESGQARNPNAGVAGERGRNLRAAIWLTDYAVNNAEQLPIGKPAYKNLLLWAKSNLAYYLAEREGPARRKKAMNLAAEIYPLVLEYRSLYRQGKAISVEFQKWYSWLDSCCWVQYKCGDETEKILVTKMIIELLNDKGLPKNWRKDRAKDWKEVNPALLKELDPELDL